MAFEDQAREPQHSSAVASSHSNEMDAWMRESPALLAAIIDSAMDAIISVDEDQRIRLFNAAAERMFRCSAVEAIGQPLDRFLPHQHRQAHREHIKMFGETGDTSRAMGHLRPLSALRADGQEFPIEASISKVEVGGRKVFTVILRDITARVQSEEQVRRLNSELERRVKERTAALTAANKELEGFTYSVAHDLRAPLRHLDAFSRIVLEEFANQLPEEGQQYLRTIRRSSRIMTRLVEDLLNLARIGKHDLRIERVELGPIAHSIVRQFQTETADRTIEWRVGPLPLAECDPGLMRQVLINLISNAVKYTRDRPNAVVEVDTVDMNGALAVRIRDNGVGFDMKYADKLFGVFQRLHPSDQFEGTGVGLATVDRIVKRHGGRVWAESAAGKGASFFFSLPTMSPGATDPAEEPDEETVE